MSRISTERGMHEIADRVWNRPGMIQAGDPRLLTGLIKRAVVRHGNQYVAWTRTWEGPARPDYPAAAADLAERPRA